jgi:hypothetical protein
MQSLPLKTTRRFPFSRCFSLSLSIISFFLSLFVPHYQPFFFFFFFFFFFVFLFLFATACHSPSTCSATHTPYFLLHFLTVSLRSTSIGFGSSRAGTAKAHGEPLGAKILAEVKTAFGFDPAASFHVGDEVRARYAPLVAAGAAKEAAWNEMVAAYAQAHPELAAEFQRRVNGHLPADWKAALPQWKPTDAAKATRYATLTLVSMLLARVCCALSGSLCQFGLVLFFKFPTYLSFFPLCINLCYTHQSTVCRGAQRARRQDPRDDGRFGRSDAVQPH